MSVLVAERSQISLTNIRESLPAMLLEFMKVWPGPFLEVAVVQGELVIRDGAGVLDEAAALIHDDFVGRHFSGIVLHD